MFKSTLLFTFFFLIPSFSSISADSKINQFPSMVEKINLEPWDSYQKLLEIEPTITSASNEEQLWFLLRKSQAENLLLFYEDFTSTVQRALLLITPSTPKEIVIHFKFYQGVIAQRESKYKKAIVLFNEAMEQAKQEDLNRLYVEIKQEMAYTKSLYENFAISLSDLQETYIEAFALQDDLLVGIINESYGAIYGFMHEYEKSIEYYQKALTIYQRLGYRAHTAEAIYGIAITYRYWKKYDLAIKYFKRYQGVVNYTPNIDITFFAFYGLGMTLAEKGDCTEAISVINQALKLHGDPDYKAELYKRKAQCLLAKNRVEDAQNTLNVASDIFDSLPELDGTRWQLEVVKIAADIAYQRGDIDKAYQLSTDYYQKYNQIIKTSFSERLANVRGALELEQKNIEIAFLQQRSQVQKLEVEKERQLNKNQQYLISFVVLIVIIGLVIVLNQRKNNQKVYALSIKDPLSDLYNRRYIFDLLTTRLDNNKLPLPQMSILLFDIDNFKEINDKYGHPFGDQVIRKIAEIAQETLRTEDVIGRVGGEEFMCVLTRIDPVQCLRIAKRLLRNIELFSFENMDGKSRAQVNITVSIGISHTEDFNGSDVGLADSAALYSQADQALYYAKDLGKNTVAEFSQIIK